MKSFINVLIKYRLYLPFSFCRNLYYNLFKISRRNRKSFFILSQHTILDLSQTSKIYVLRLVLFGWCNMRKSRMETALCMARKSTLILGGGNIGYGSYIQIGEKATLEIGDSFINREVKIVCNNHIKIGDGCIIAMGTVIRDNDGGNHKIKALNYVNSKPVVIGNHVWIGENVMILKGVTIGEGSVIAAHSLVTKDIPPHCLAMGAPAKVVRENIEWEA